VTVTSHHSAVLRWCSYLLVVLIGTIQFAESIRAADAPKPNVLIIVTDDQRIGTMGMMPETRRRFFEEGTWFDNAFATSPLCCPSRASIMTGRYAHNHGVRTNSEGGRLDHETTIQRYLQDQGYLTALGGRFLNGWQLDEAPPHFDRYGLLQRGYVDPRANIDGALGRIDGYTTDVLRDYVVDVLTDFDLSRDAAPWFMYVTPLAPHRPALPEVEYRSLEVPPFRATPSVLERDRTDKPPYVRFLDADMASVRRFRARQLRTLRSVDHLVRELFQVLEEKGELQNTLAFYLSDNGYLWGEHGLTGKGHSYTRSVRIPFAMRWPAAVVGGTSDERLAANIDIAPTVLDAVGISQSAVGPIDGRSLLSEVDRSRLLFELRGVRNWASLRTETYQYTEHYRDGGRVRFREYYRLTKDPWQLRNLLGDDRRANDPGVSRLHRQLRQARSCVGPDGPSACP
jgi:arylsulfatase A-like enzyme